MHRYFCLLVLLAATLSLYAQEPAGIHRVKIGSVEVIALQDGELKLDPALLQGIDQGSIAGLLGGTDPVPTSVNAFLVRTGKHLVLVDAGARGNAYGGDLGHLVERLRKAGVNPEAIEAVLITHLHFDHISGLITADGQRAFPRAQIRLAQSEYDYWMNPALETTFPEARKAALRQIKATLAPYQAQGACRPFAPGEAPFPGVTAIPAPGHTPGHTVYALGSGKESVWFVGDIVHFGKVQFKKPEATVAFDTDSAKAAASRLDVLTRAADTGAVLGGSHLAFPALGHVGAKPGSFEWISLSK